MSAVACSFSFGHTIKLLCPDCSRQFNEGEVLGIVCNTTPFHILGVIGGISVCCGNTIHMPRVFKDGHSMKTWYRNHGINARDIYDIEALIRQLGLSNDEADALAAKVMLDVCLRC
jgi:hypothetical protein